MCNYPQKLVDGFLSGPSSSVRWVPKTFSTKTFQVAIEAIKNQQKMFSALQDLIEIQEEDFYNIVERKVQLQENISLKMAYGTDEIAAALFEWIDDKNEKVLESISTIVDLVSDWDDLWVSYAIASLELEIATFSGKSTIVDLVSDWDDLWVSYAIASLELEIATFC